MNKENNNKKIFMTDYKIEKSAITLPKTIRMRGSLRRTMEKLQIKEHFFVPLTDYPKVTVSGTAYFVGRDTKRKFSVLGEGEGSRVIRIK